MTHLFPIALLADEKKMQGGDSLKSEGQLLSELKSIKDQVVAGFGADSETAKILASMSTLLVFY